MKKHKIHLLTMLVGLLVAASVICTNVFYPKEVKKSGATVPVERSADEPVDLTFTAAPTISFPSSSYVQLTLETYCLFEISGTGDDRSFDVSDFSIYPRRFLTTLFTVIISPNAP